MLAPPTTSASTASSASDESTTASEVDLSSAAEEGTAGVASTTDDKMKNANRMPRLCCRRRAIFSTSTLGLICLGILAFWLYKDAVNRCVHDASPFPTTNPSVSSFAKLGADFYRDQRQTEYPKNPAPALHNLSRCIAS